MTKIAVVALGGNALLTKAQPPTIENQFENARQAMGQLVRLVRWGWELVITHGNGPQVGHILIRAESAKENAYPLPLSVAVAESEGEIGYILQQALYNELAQSGIHRPIVTILTQVLVDPEDPAFSEPTKPIGPFMTEEQASSSGLRGVPSVHFPEYGWRRVVASPRPLEIIEGDTIRRMVEQEVIVIAAGGGGIPVCKRQGRLEGVNAVIDKDPASAVLSLSVKAEMLLFLTDVRKVSLNYQKPNQVDIDRMSVGQAERYLSEGHFPPGTMGPKVEGALQFVKGSGRSAIITTPEALELALDGRDGTWITP